MSSRSRGRGWIADAAPTPFSTPVTAQSASARLRIVILSRKRRLYSTRRLADAARALGHEARVVDTLAIDLLVENGAPRLYHQGRELPTPHLVVPRIGASITSYGLAVVNQIEGMGIPVLNGAEAIARSRDKLRCLQILAQAGIPVPRTVMMRRRDHLDEALERIGGLPVIVKLLRGSQGIGVMLAQSHEELTSTLDTFWTLDQEILLQEFIAESRGRDIRALVVGDRVVGAMRRTARVEGEFRSNLHRGGKGSRVELDAAYEKVAVEAARVVGLEVAGVDLLESAKGPKVAEINSSPGLRGIERTLDVDVATEIMAHGVAQARRASGASSSISLSGRF